MGTSSITPCYDLERLETKTHVGLSPGESTEYTKHRVSLEGNPWPGYRPVNDTWCPYSYGQTKQKRGLNNVGQVNPKDCYLKERTLACKAGASMLQNLANVDSEDQPAASQMSEMDTPLDHAQDEAMPLVEWALTPMGHCNPEEEYANGIASTNHLEIICFVTGPPLAWLPKPTKDVLNFCTERSLYILRALMRQSRDSWLPVGGKNAESVMTWALN